VLAQWCPHCVPLSLEKCKQMAEGLGAELRVLDLDDPKQVKIADSLVKEHGDQSDDYLIPQVFFEEDGRIHHVFTGFSEAVAVTKGRWDDFFTSQFYQRRLKSAR
jgi:hypothetical protein